MTQPTTVVPSPRPLRVTGAGLTHAGRVRDRNEDSILTDPSGSLWAVADGMGGYGHGDVASDLVIEALATIPDGGDPPALLKARLRQANAAILADARRLGPMGSTAVAMIVADGIAHLAWVGDSRGYLCRGGRLRMLTRDHSVVQDLIDRGELRPEAAEYHPDGHVVTRAVGATAEVEVDVVEVALAPGDRLLLCSDGLSGCVPERQIERRLGAAADAGTACRALVADALDAGAPDNVSVIAVFVG